jgi:hypothetical protein
MARASHLCGKDSSLECCLALHPFRIPLRFDETKQQSSWLLRTPCVSSRVIGDHEEDEVEAHGGQHNGHSDIKFLPCQSRQLCILRGQPYLRRRHHWVQDNTDHRALRRRIGRFKLESRIRRHRPHRSQDQDPSHPSHCASKLQHKHPRLRLRRFAPLQPGHRRERGADGHLRASRSLKRDDRN